MQDSTDKAPPKVPAWKLRRELMRKNNAVPTALYVKDRANEELGGTRSWSSNRASRKFDDSGSLASVESNTGSTRSTSSWSTNYSQRSSYSQRSTRSQRSASSAPSCHVSRHIRPVSRVPGSSSSSVGPSLVSRVPGSLDPSLPPAFRAAFRREQEKKQQNNKNYLGSVASHSRTDGQGSIASDLSSLDSGDEDNDFDDQSSFASIDSDADEEDDAYLEFRNQMARVTIETSMMKKLESGAKRRRPKSRFQKKTTGVHSMPLGLIAE